MSLYSMNGLHFSIRSSWEASAVPEAPCRTVHHRRISRKTLWRIWKDEDYVRFQSVSNACWLCVYTAIMLPDRSCHLGTLHEESETVLNKHRNTLSSLTSRAEACLHCLICQHMFARKKCHSCSLNLLFHEQFFKLAAAVISIVSMLKARRFWSWTWRLTAAFLCRVLLLVSARVYSNAIKINKKNKAWDNIE